jgi:hypothetical protein
MIYRNLAIVVGAAFLAACVANVPPARAEETADGDGWISLFDGKSLDGWDASEHKDTWRVEDGKLVCNGDRSHLFYSGPVHNHDFKNFELKLEVMTRPGANSGIFFHTEYQESDWPAKGYEAQVNNSQEDWRRTGSLYGVEDIRESPVADNEWFDYHIIVRDRQITLIVDGQTTVDYTEPEGGPHVADRPERFLSHGTIALQAHDPGSVVYYCNIRIKPLP